MPQALLALAPEMLAGSPAEVSEMESDGVIYSKSPDWARKQADKYLPIIKEAGSMKGEELKKFLSEWNALHPESSVSYPQFMNMRNRYKINGIAGLLSKHGGRAGHSDVPDDLFGTFSDLWLKEGAPSLKSCWLRVRGILAQSDPYASDFPSPASFQRRMDKEVPQSVQYKIRFGHDKWNRKYSSYINRNYDNIRAGEVWVSDHHQLDVCVINPETGKPCFPWVTAWIDFKTSKWLGWIMRCLSPNSDPIFQGFYIAVKAHGLPSEIIIDNGKDYRCKDFAGGRKNISVSTEQSSPQISTLGVLNVKVHFAAPYGAQTKTIERSFGSIISMFCRHQTGYRGGNVTERPEKLDAEISSGNILDFADLSKLFDEFVEEGLNNNASRGKNLLGKSPNQLWAEEYTTKREFPADALALFCMRTTGTVSIGRNGLHDNEFGVTYWADWMAGRKGEKVYARRDVKNYAEAWIFSAKNNELLGVARMNAFSSPALAKTEIEKQTLREALARKKREVRIIKAYARAGASCDPFEDLRNLTAGIKAVSGAAPQASPKVHELTNTAMEKAIKRRGELEAIGNVDVSGLTPEQLPEEPFFDTETDRDLYLRRMRKIA